MSEHQQHSDELLQLTQKWIDGGTAPADVVETLIQTANRIIDRSNLEYDYLRRSS